MFEVYARRKSGQKVFVGKEDIKHPAKLACGEPSPVMTVG
jgi:hypothetical protein